MDFVPRKRGALELFLIGLAQRCHQEGFQTVFVFSGEPVPWFSEGLTGIAAIRILKGCPVKEGFSECKDILHCEQADLKTFWFVSLYNRKTLRLALMKGKSIFIDQMSWQPKTRTGLNKWAAWVAGHVFSRAYWRVLSVSEFNRQRNISQLFVPKAKTCRVYNGCPLISEQLSKAGDLPQDYIFFAGQLAGFKGVETLVRAFDLVKTAAGKVPGIQLLLAGEGPDREKLAQLVQDRGLDKAVVFLGRRDDVPALMAHARINVVPSEWPEAFGFVAAEAMLTGVPLIVSDAGALPEVVADTATVFPKGNPAALADCLSDVLEKPGNFKAMAAQAKTRAEKEFTTQRMVDDYVSLFAEALGCKQTA